MIDLVDTHCHMTDLADDEVEAQIARAKASCVNRMICIGVGETIASAKRAVELATKHEEVFASVGIHPHDAKAGAEISHYESLACEKKVVAIGESGLDYFRDWSPFEEQRRVFRDTISFARNIKKPLIIHSRNAREETLQTLIECKAHEVGGVFHCYSEDIEFAKKVLDINFAISFTGVVTFKNASALREVVAFLPEDRFMLETDAPYMAPEPFRGQKSEPAHVYNIAQKVAQVRGVDLEKISEITSATAKRIFDWESQHGSKRI